MEVWKVALERRDSNITMSLTATKAKNIITGMSIFVSITGCKTYGFNSPVKKLPELG
jgi:hypothetical protein